MARIVGLCFGKLMTLADLIGLDTCLAIMETLYDGFKNSK